MSEASAAPEAKQDLEKVPAIGIQMTTQLGPDRALNLSCWLPLDSTIVELNTTLDKFWNAAWRLEARSKIEFLAKSIQGLENDRKNATRLMAKIDFAKDARKALAKDRGRQGEPKAPPQEDEHRSVHQANIELCTEKIAQFTKDLAELKEVAYGDSDVSPNMLAGATDR